MAVKHNSEIIFKVGLDENKVPEEISWTAKDGGIDNEISKSIMISVWDHKKKDTLKMDLWTKDMPVDEMKQFYHQTLVSMSHTRHTPTYPLAYIYTYTVGVCGFAPWFRRPPRATSSTSTRHQVVSVAEWLPLRQAPKKRTVRVTKMTKARPMKRRQLPSQRDLCHRHRRLSSDDWFVLFAHHLHSNEPIVRLQYHQSFTIIH